MELRSKLALSEQQCSELKAAHDTAAQTWRAEEETLRRSLSEREAELRESRVRLDEQAHSLQQRKDQLQKTAALGAQLQGIQSMLTELGRLEEAA